MPRSAGETAPYLPTAHCTLAPYASAGVALRSNADESRGLYGAFGKFYGEYDPDWFEERPYPYLNENTMSLIVDDMVKAILMIVEKLKHIELENLQSSSEILPKELMFPYEMPLGDA